MLPLSFSDLADAPTIVSSPHQHQFDPITSRAAHSIYYHQQSCKPLMPTRHWDHPIAMSKATPITGNPSTKRSRNEQEEETSSDKIALSSKTPYNSPTNATTRRAGDFMSNIASSQVESEEESQKNFHSEVAQRVIDMEDSKPLTGSTSAQPDYTPVDSQAKRARAQDGDEQFSAHTYPDGSTHTSDVFGSQSKALEGSNDSSTGVALTEGAAKLQNQDGTWGGAQPEGQNHQPVDQPQYHPSSPNLSRSLSDQSQVAEHDDTSAPAEQMDLD